MNYNYLYLRFHGLVRKRGKAVWTLYVNDIGLPKVIAVLRLFQMANPNYEIGVEKVKET